MAKQKPLELFMPPNILKAKVGGTGAGLDTSAIKRAEAVMETLRADFRDWINADVAHLVVSREAYAAKPDEVTHGGLYRASHDLKGQALTFEHPIVARVASSLCKLLDGPNGVAPLTLIDAHVNAIRILVRQNVKNAADPTTSAVASELEARVTEILAATP